MAIENENPDVFYLGFNKNTGNFVDFIPPKGREIVLDPKEVLLLDLDKAGSNKDKILKKIDDFNELVREAALPPVTITFVDTPGSSICCGSINGVPFRYRC